MSTRRQVSDDDLVLEFADVMRVSGSLRAAVLAVACLSRRKRRPVGRVFPPAVVETARYFCVGPRELLGDDRRPGATDPRHVAMWVARQAGMSWPQLGRAFSRDASTVRYACARVDRNLRLLASGREIAQRMEKNASRLVAALDHKEAA